MLGLQISRLRNGNNLEVQETNSKIVVKEIWIPIESNMEKIDKK